MCLNGFMTCILDCSYIFYLFGVWYTVLECTHTWPSRPVPCRSTNAPPPALTTLQSNCAWARWRSLIFGVPAFISPHNKIFRLLSSICDLKDSLGFFHCFLCGHCLLLSAWIWGETSTVTAMSALRACTCIRAKVHLFQQCQGREISHSS